MPDYLNTDTAPTVAPYGVTTETSGMTPNDRLLLWLAGTLVVCNLISWIAVLSTR